MPLAPIAIHDAARITIEGGEILLSRGNGIAARYVRQLTVSNMTMRFVRVPQSDAAFPRRRATRRRRRHLVLRLQRQPRGKQRSRRNRILAARARAGIPATLPYAKQEKNPPRLYAHTLWATASRARSI
ncbi:MAG: hypothetical protein WDN04_17110 [Rhodospirillales bacterium]